MKRSVLAWLFVTTLLLIGFALTRTAAQERTRPESVSLIQLIANPDKYDGHQVRVIGFVRIEFEGNAVYLHEEDDKYAISDNALWLSLPNTKSKEEYERYHALDGKYVIIEGVFSSKNRGQMGMFSGSIGHITRFDHWADVSGWQPHGTITPFK